MEGGRGHHFLMGTVFIGDAEKVVGMVGGGDHPTL